MQPTTHTAEPTRSLRRATEGRMIAGVCAGLADYFDVDVVLVRIVVAVLALIGGIGLPLYLAAWLLVPEEETDTSIAEHLIRDVRSPHDWPAHVRAFQGSDGDQDGGGHDVRAS